MGSAKGQGGGVVRQLDEAQEFVTDCNKPLGRGSSRTQRSGGGEQSGLINW